MNPSRFTVLLVSILLTVATVLPMPADAQGDPMSTIPEVSADELDAALQLAGANRSELEAALDSCQQKPFTMAAMRFVIANLPLSDLGVISSDMLIENVELAMDAWAAYPYGADVDEATWAHYVLPPRFSQEPLSGWRPYLREQLHSVVGECQTLEEAAIAVNYWCGERTVFKQTQRRDQDPVSTLKGGYGRCEELAMLLIAACRSVGIPARYAYCPWWTWSDNNHAWVEIYGSDGRWHFTGGCEPKETLDKAWFEQAARRAPLVVSTCFGLPDELSCDIISWEYRPGARYVQYNSVEFYRRAGRIELDIPGADSSDSLWLYVYNFGALRTLKKLDIDGSGLANVTLGAGDYVLTTNAPVESQTAMFTIVEGERLEVSWDGLAPMPQEIVLVYPESAE